MPYTSWSESVLKSSLLATLGRIHLCSGVYSRSLVSKESRSVLDNHMEMVEAASKDMCLETMHEVRVARSQKCKFAVFEGESKCCECKRITDRFGHYHSFLRIAFSQLAVPLNRANRHMAVSLIL